MWRCWVCYRCKIVSYHPVVRCPTCPNLFEFVSGPSSELERRFPSVGPDSEFTPYEAAWPEPDPRQTWVNKTWEEIERTRPLGPPAPTDTRERQADFYNQYFGL
jgi:hypothetical protein